ncbi:class I SAM-dependent methyltransferase [Rhodococcus sp. NBC_00294]|uniref:class I SAM-dependent methyltransferase n=1 Tax=Rhodococcus sp. NBC_00294 TaxID=2976004 RepID=UPI002E2AE583|nr:class I SAM-dependent methyltransferase [Rhodococcus sp. NBC_00294]
MSSCRACASATVSTVLDLGLVPAADSFPTAESSPEGDEMHALAMGLCTTCGLAQLLDDDTRADEPRGVEPEALTRAASRAMDEIVRRGWLPDGAVVREYGSPHGGSWIPDVRSRGVADAGPAVAGSRSADLVVDGFGLMHEPDQAAALRERRALLGDGGVLVLQVHSFMTIVRDRQWTALRHGHFAYWSSTALETALWAAGLMPTGCWESDLYGGTLLVSAMRDDSVRLPVWEDDLVTARRVREAEAAAAVTDPTVVSSLGAAAVAEVEAVRARLGASSRAGVTLAAYGAASRAVALFAMAGVTTETFGAVVDASPAKWGRRMPGTDVPIVGPEWLYTHRPDRVVVTVPDLLPEVAAAHPEMSFVDLDSATEGLRS